ncbi:hypothetical protein [Corynebacterium bovis]|uniref:hypothetical protein n=1 Tax=Corynebacterium bovis TaxID=36808 RepID=UPI003138E287
MPDDTSSVVEQPVYTDPGYGQDQDTVAGGGQAPAAEPVYTPDPVYTDTDAVSEVPATAPVVDVPVDADPVSTGGDQDAAAEPVSADGDQAPVAGPAGAQQDPAGGQGDAVVPVLGTGSGSVRTLAGGVSVEWTTVPYRTTVTATTAEHAGGRVDLPQVAVGTWHDGGVDYAIDGAEGFVTAPPGGCPGR